MEKISREVWTKEPDMPNHLESDTQRQALFDMSKLGAFVVAQDSDEDDSSSSDGKNDYMDSEETEDTPGVSADPQSKKIQSREHEFSPIEAKSPTTPQNNNIQIPMNRDQILYNKLARWKAEKMEKIPEMDTIIETPHQRTLFFSDLGIKAPPGLILKQSASTTIDSKGGSSQQNLKVQHGRNNSLLTTLSGSGVEKPIDRRGLSFSNSFTTETFQYISDKKVDFPVSTSEGMFRAARLNKLGGSFKESTINLNNYQSNNSNSSAHNSEKNLLIHSLLYKSDARNYKKSNTDNKSNKSSAIFNSEEKLNSRKNRRKNHKISNKTNEFNINIENAHNVHKTTLMIRNIPNKYTQDLMLERIDRNFKEDYDFFYLPIDFRNKCNVGYAFINLKSTTAVKPFFLDFNDKKWERFNSEKVCTINYARIQGKNALIKHFKNSSVMNQNDKKLKPLILNKNSIQKLVLKQKSKLHKASTEFSA